MSQLAARSTPSPERFENSVAVNTRSDRGSAVTRRRLVRISTVTTPQIFFSDYFSVPRKTVEDYGSFDINLVADVRLFVDPFLLFNSSKSEYQALHEHILDYLKYLKSIARADLDKGTVKDLFRFQEVSQNWFGYCKLGNKGHGLGEDFARALNSSIGRIIGLKAAISRRFRSSDPRSEKTT
jgi:hypothetical protein